MDGDPVVACKGGKPGQAASSAESAAAAAAAAAVAAAGQVADEEERWVDHKDCKVAVTTLSVVGPRVDTLLAERTCPVHRDFDQKPSSCCDRLPPKPQSPLDSAGNHGGRPGSLLGHIHDCGMVPCRKPTQARPVWSKLVEAVGCREKAVERREESMKRRDVMGRVVDMARKT